MLSFPHLVVLFVIALVIFGPQKLPELARMLGRATAEFRKMTNDFRYALEDEVRELERQTRIREEQAAAAKLTAEAPIPSPSPAPEGAVPRDLPSISGPATPAESPKEAAALPEPVSDPSPAASADAVTVPHEKSSDDNPAV